MKTAMALLFLVATVGGCSTTSEVKVELTTLGGESLAPSAIATRLDLTLKEVSVHVAGETADGTDPGRPGGWVTVFSGSQVIDAYDLAATTGFLESVEAPAGRVTQVRLVLGDHPRLVVGKMAIPVACPSCTQSGLKIVPHGTLEVPEGGTLTLTLEFDGPASLQHGEHGYRLDPVFRL